ncbi:serine hydrolase domain-containing protein [Shewanella sp.]|uniref:serine hydrolase domain-containing protein n=1 Tax=Shewanella sp. TaxID=50422 RepID=UPI0035698227
MILKWIYANIILISVLANSVACAATGLQERNERLKTHLNKELATDFQGEVLLRQHGRPLYQSSRATSGEAYATKGNLYVIGSMSKTVFAAFYLAQHEAQLNQPLDQNSLPAILRRPAPLTPLMLLSHTSGINRNGNGLHDKKQGDRAAFVYSNANYQLLATLLFPASSGVEPTVRSSIPEDTKPRLQSALNTFFSRQQLDIQAQTGELSQIMAREPRLRAGFQEQLTENGPQLTVTELTIAEPELASGFLIASVDGMADFQDRLFGGKTLLPSALNAMVTPWAEREHRWGSLGYGLGLQIAQQPLEYSHSGYVPGYMSLMLYYPESGLQLVMLDNVSRDLTDMERAFARMDRLRQLVREYANSL